MGISKLLTKTLTGYFDKWTKEKYGVDTFTKLNKLGIKKGDDTVVVHIDAYISTDSAGLEKLLKRKIYKPFNER